MNIMNNDIFVKLDIAVEILAHKTAITLREGHDIESPEVQELLKERDLLYNGDKEIINKIIDVYGKELKERLESDSKDKTYTR